MARRLLLTLAPLLAVAVTQCRAPAERAGAASEARPYVPLTRADGGPLSPLALAGRDVFVREGCYVCHAVTPPGAGAAAAWPEEELVGKPGRQHAPGLGQVGGKYPALWHFHHLQEPERTSHGSIMPGYPFLLEQRLGPAVAERVTTLLARSGGAPGQDPAALGGFMRAEGQAIAASLTAEQADAAPDSELVALIAYLQQLDHPGSDPRVPPPPPPLSDADRQALDQRLSAAAPAWAARGAELFAKHCAVCHGERGQGQIGPALSDGEWLHGGSPSAVLRTITHGVPSKGMVAWDPILTEADREALAAWVAVTLQAPR